MAFLRVLAVFAALAGCAAPGAGAPGATASQAVAAVRAVAPGCDRVTVSETRFHGPAEPARRGGGMARPWGETWVLGACGRLYAVPMEFTPEEGGTSVRVDARAVRPVN